ncbi:MAG: chromate resistance protein [Deltaproteobacteria bacterium]|nr:chromate resistance protein [Deltaproteobacteria bacterium]
MFPRGEIIKEGIAFDTPDAIFKRYYNMSTFKFMLKHYRLRDPKLIHDIEVNIWGDNE